MAPSPPTIERLTGPPGAADLRGLARLLVDAVDSGAAVSFVPPLSMEDAEAWWRETLSEASDRAVVLVARLGEKVIGSVQIHPAWAPNQPHRADLVKLLVHRDARGTGLGTRLMTAVENEARARGFRLLTLDAKSGGAAHRLYRRLGWTELGTIPDYALDPDGSPHDAVFFYKRIDASG